MMLRWNTNKHIESENAAVDAFIEDLVTVYRKHNMSVSHEDGHGSFVIEPFSELNVEWISQAHDATDSQA
jgi:hypothetical protein